MLSAGSIIYAFASQGVILPLENKMKKPKEMFGPCGVITTASIVIFFINTVTGFLGYVTYGQELKGSITLNLTNSPLDFTVKIMLLVMTYCGYPIEIYPVVEMLWPYVERHVDSSRKRVVSALQYALQYAAVMVSCKSCKSLLLNLLLISRLQLASPMPSQISRTLSHLLVSHPG
ncbi:hypothetical protein OESDEN_05049 [Oesophagostomum dentatum]|uniref:Amino acid transporter transmembrane domain-containing protein n=1 Tax=Oesophagostomum dentatum TaxID=61180 RepID=A0A0B1TFX0_OESDE|nr:hypothetical protein OESDEN_05049 [Oesophagostomum dentatum]